MGVKRTLLVSLCLVTATCWAAGDPYEEAAKAAMQGDHVLMQQRYERILATNPDDVRALNGKATAQAWRGNYFAAIETFQMALSREPENIESLVGIGYAFSWAGDHAYAVDSFEKALEVAPGHLGARKGLAYTALWSGDAATARERFEVLSAENEDDADLAVSLGQANLQDGRARGAISAFDHALALEPGREDAVSGRRAALGGAPVFEASAWYGSTSSADSGLRLVELGWWAGRDTRLGIRYDDSLSLDNPAIIRDGESAETLMGGVLHNFGERFTGLVELGTRSLPDGDETIVRGELTLHNLPGKLTLGTQVGDHDLGYNNSLYYVGIGFPLGDSWQLESNNYFSTTGLEQDKEWRSVLNVLYEGDSGWNAVLGGGLGEVNYGGLDNPDNVTVAHAMFTMPVFGFHRAHLAVRHEKLPGGDVNIAMIGFTYRLPR
jgi:tetratricopeptide (TPR) repeat protein